jgi:hypothetical protein
MSTASASTKLSGKEEVTIKKHKVIEVLKAIEGIKRTLLEAVKG